MNDNDVIVVIPAIAALQRYITQHYGTVNNFARENKLDAADLSKILRHERNRGYRVSVQFADKIEKATKGVVGIRMWLPVVRRAS